MKKDKWTIYWREYVSYAYASGSKISFLAKDNIAYDNRLMPPGTVIKEWFSKTNHQAMRIEPTLPLIDGEGAYKLSVNMDYEGGPEEEIMLRVIFLDRYDTEFESIILRGESNYFNPPIKTFNYKLQLINGGITKFNFHSMTLEEVEREEFDAEQQRIEKIKEASRKRKVFRRRNRKVKR